jgi:F-type H+-transporting ATPase subunit gamma
MSGGKEIRTKIKSIQNTQKITKAMEMVAASKMRKAQERQAAGRPYADRIRTVIGHLKHANPDYHHPFMDEREAKRVGFIIVSTDRGLCGGLNNNLFKRTVNEIYQWQQQGAEVAVCVIGSKALGFFKRIKVEMASSVTHIGDTPHVEQLIGTVKVMLDKYRDGEIDRVFMCHNRFVNTMTQDPVVVDVLPLPDEDADALQSHWDYIYEPDAAEILDGFLMRYIESQVYQGAVENIACEQAARMVAMKSATDNAGDLIEELQLIYNKARQASITQEISEIVSGAAAV